MTNKIFFATFATIMLFSLTACSYDDSVERGPEIGKIGNDYVYLYDMISAGKFQSFSRKDIKFRKDRLIHFIKNEMYSREGYSMGLHKSESVQEKLLNHVNKNMSTVVYKKIVLDKFTNEMALKNLYERLQKRVSARHILISHRDADRGNRKADRSKEEALEYIIEIKSKINSLSDFVKYANDISEDQASADGGDLGFFEWGQMENAFQETAFSLEPKIISSPIETSYGYHIIWVDSVKNIAQKPFEQMRETLKSKAYAIHRSEINQTAEDFIDSLNSAASTKFYDENIEILISKINSFKTSQKKHTNRQSPLDFIKSVELPGPLVTYTDNGNEISINTEPIAKLLQNPSSGWSIDRIADVNILKNVLKDESNQQLIKQFGFRSKYDEAEDVLKDLKKKEQEFMRQEITKIEIINKVDPDENKLLTYYNQHKDKYVSAGVSDIREILIADKSVADSLYLLVSNGQDMSALASSFSERISADKNGGVLRDITRAKLSPIGKIAASMKVGDLSVPVKVGTKWSFFKVLSKSPPGYKPFEDVTSRVSVDFRRDEIKHLRAVFEDYLKEKYKPKYYFDNYIPEITEGGVE